MVKKNIAFENDNIKQWW